MTNPPKAVTIILNDQKVDTLVENLLKNSMTTKAVHKYAGNLQCITDETTTLLFPKIHQEFVGYSNVVKAYIKVATLGLYLQKDPSILHRLSLKTTCIEFY